MKHLEELQKQLKEIIMLYEEKTSGRIDNKNQIKQFNALVRNEDISDELVNFIIDSTDEINTRHFELVEHTTKVIKDLSEVTHADIEAFKQLLAKLEEEELNKKTKKWYNVSTWTLKDAKFMIIATIISILIIGALFNVEFGDNINKVYNVLPKELKVGK